MLCIRRLVLSTSFQLIYNATAIFVNVSLTLALAQLDASGLEAELKALLTLFEQRETEDNWTKFEDALNRLAAVVRGSHQLPQFVHFVKRLKIPLNNCVGHFPFGFFYTINTNTFPY
ncbi:hypothetical protein HK102_010340 [Quaeritorhiza haematococci]|nr:hypothetical protein HK102_010340 [Quaeritorhiza haematococci]